MRFGHRDYDPEVGRFNAQDPLGDTGGDHDLYEYCVDDPVNAVDPEGLRSENVAEAERTVREQEQTAQAREAGQEAFSRALEKELDLAGSRDGGMEQQTAQAAWDQAKDAPESAGEKEKQGKTIGRILWAGAKGAMGGGTVGGAIGSAVPIVGTAVGATAGAVIGAPVGMIKEVLDDGPENTGRDIAESGIKGAVSSAFLNQPDFIKNLPVGKLAKGAAGGAWGLPIGMLEEVVEKAIDPAARIDDVFGSLKNANKTHHEKAK
ncbi:MAG: RHS repeat-associated core domain-containing protein [Thermodesulfobacteriota bacterium]